MNLKKINQLKCSKYLPLVESAGIYSIDLKIGCDEVEKKLEMRTILHLFKYVFERPWRIMRVDWEMASKCSENPQVRL